MTQKSPIHRNYVQMSGYKDIFYNPLTNTKKNPLTIIKNNPLTIIKNNPPSPIEISSPNNLIKKCILRVPEIVENTIYPNIINKTKVNSIDTNFIFPSSPEKLSPEIIKENSFIFENIKYKMIDIMFQESLEKKIELTNYIIKLLKKNNISEEELSLFLQKL